MICYTLIVRGESKAITTNKGGRNENVHRNSTRRFSGTNRKGNKMSVLDNMSKRNADDAIKAIDYFLELKKNGNIYKEDVPKLYGDGSRWGTLTKKGFITVYECYIEAEDLTSRNT
jgi:hypothetical protein